MAKAATKTPAKTGRPAAREAPARRPARPLTQLRTEVDRLLSDFLRGYWHIPFGRAAIDVEPYWRGDISFGGTPAVDIVDKPDVYKLTAELPGVNEGDVEIRFSDGKLTIEGRKVEDEDDEKHDHFLSERRYGTFHRSFRVPDGIDAEGIEGSFKNGILTVTLPKTAEARKAQRKISVKGA